MLISTAKIATTNPQRIMNRLSKHWAHKFSVQLEENSSFIPLSIGNCSLQCEEELLEVKLTATAENLDRLQEVVADHLCRMASKEELIINWQEK